MGPWKFQGLRPCADPREPIERPIERPISQAIFQVSQGRPKSKNEPGFSEIRKIEGFDVFEKFSKIVKNAFWRALWASLGAPVASWVPSGAPGGGFEPLEGGIEAYSLLIRIFSTPGIEPVRRWESNPFVAIPAFCYI